MEQILIEIKSSEGGDDSKLLVNDMANIYTKFCNKNDILCRVIETRPGFVKL